MALSYLWRMICLCFACFFLVHLAAGLGLAALIQPLAPRLQRLRARTATHLLFALRLLPAMLALLAVGAFCAPSYLLLEKFKTERVGLACCALAALGLTIAATAVVRALHALWSARRYEFDSLHSGRATQVCAESHTVTVLDCPRPMVTMTGLLQPRIVVTDGVLRNLTSDQLDLALRHEHAHWFARDNLKRLLFLLAPEVLPFSHAFAGLQHHWERLSEWAADDAATAGDVLRSLSLAAALVQVARMGAAPRPTPLATSLVDGAADLTARVNRLVEPTPSTDPSLLRPSLWVAVTAVTLAIAVAAPQHATLHFMHEALEHLIR